MKKSLPFIFLVILLICSINFTFSQQVTIDNTVPLTNLIENHLANGCVEISNVSSTINGSVDGIGSFGSFQSGNSNFPLSNGIVLTTGNAAAGGNTPNATELSDGSINWGTDPDFETFLGIGNTVNATSIEFDFVALSDSVLFNYILASEEYSANYPCNASDGFVFLIKESSSSGPYQNIALVPGTNLPVSIRNIHDEIITQCPAANDQYFDGFFNNTNYTGRTTVLSAGTSVTPNVQYHVKIIVAEPRDLPNPLADTAVFIESSTFTELELGDDINTCSGSVTLDGTIQNPLADYTWFRNGTIISNETNPTLITSQSGLYRVEISINGVSCSLSDEVNVTIDTELTAGPISPYQLCDLNGDGQEIFNLSTKNADVINAIQNLPTSYALSYHLSDADARSNSGSITTPINSSSRTIYVRVVDTVNGCLIYGTFELIVSPRPTITIPSNLNVCDNDNTPDGMTVIDFRQKDNEITSGQPNLFVTYHYTALDASSGNNPLPAGYINTNPSETFFIRVTNSVSGCSNFGGTLTINVTNGNTGIVRNTQYIDACDPQHDGFAIFDITQVIGTILNGETGFLPPTYHTSISDAETGANPIPNPTNFQNTDPDEQIIYVRLVDSTTGCYAIVPIEIHSNLLLTGTTIPPLGFAFCDDDNDGSVDIYFNQMENVIANGLPNVTVLFYESISDRTNNIPIDTSNPYPITGPQTIYLKLENGFCTEISDVIFRINPVITFSPVAPIDYCDTDSDGFTTVDFNTFDTIITGGNTNFGVRYFLNYNDADSGLNQLPRYYDTSSGTFYARIENSTTGCYTVNSFDITVVPAPDTMQPNDIIICDNDQDGFSVVNLNNKIPEIVSNTSGLIIDFFDDLNNANNNVSPITNRTAYNANTQTIFTRVQSTASSGCFAIVTFEIIVNTLPIIPNIAPFQMCVDPGISSANFIFADKDNEILNGQTGKEVFYFSDSGFTSLINKNSPYSSVGAETIYVRVENITDASCNSTSSFTLEVASNPTYNTNFTDFPPVCQNGAGNHTFDLGAKRQEIAQGSTDVLSIKFYLTYAEAQNNANTALPDQHTSSTLQGQFYARIENTANSCSVIEEVRFITFPTPVITSATIAPICDTNYDGNANINLNTTMYQVNNVRFDPITVTYFEDEELNIPIPPAQYNNYPASNKTIYIKIANTNTQCFDSAPLALQVNLPPAVNNIGSLTDCDSTTNTYNLSIADALLVANVNNVVITYHNSSAQALSGTNPIPNKVYNYPSAGTYPIFARVQNLANGCPAFTSFNLLISPNPIANPPANLVDCDDDFDGFFLFDLSQQDNSILAGQSPTNFNVSYYNSLANAENGINPLNILYPAITGETIFARVENNTTGCYSTTQFTAIVNPLPIIPLKDIEPICINDLPKLLNANTGQAGDTYLWWTGETTSEIYVDLTDLGDHWVSVSTPQNCSYTKNFTLIESEEANINFTTTVDFADPNSITVNISGIGNYEFALDGGIPQKSNVFNNVTLGAHIVTIIDLNGCEPVYAPVFVIDIPKFVTPNNDGAFDRWHIVGANQLPGTIVYIYDRYGKLLKTLPYTSPGWDGTFNGQNMPADDYWFVAKVIQNGNAFDVKGHFALVR